MSENIMAPFPSPLPSLLPPLSLPHGTTLFFRDLTIMFKPAVPPKEADRQAGVECELQQQMTLQQTQWPACPVLKKDRRKPNGIHACGFPHHSIIVMLRHRNHQGGDIMSNSSRMQEACNNASTTQALTPPTISVEGAGTTAILRFNGRHAGGLPFISEACDPMQHLAQDLHAAIVSVAAQDTTTDDEWPECVQGDLVGDVRYTGESRDMISIPLSCGKDHIAYARVTGWQEMEDTR